MPYKVNNDLPDNVKNHLPEHAQTIFRKAFNSALHQYHNEVSAFKVAWSAVEKTYKKDATGKWVKK